MIKRLLLQMVFVFIIPLTVLAALPPVLLPQTGQTLCYDESGGTIDCAGTGQDGELRNGVPFPNPRFTDHGNGEVTDNMTGLIWTIDGDLMNTRDPSFDPNSQYHFGQVSWPQALNYIKKLNNDNYLGHSDWRLPNRIELESLIYKPNVVQALPDGHPFTGVAPGYYWTSSTNAGITSYAWQIDTFDFRIFSNGKEGGYGYIWPIRGIQSEVSPPPLMLAKTGQTTSYASGDDGNLQLGVAWPTPRFIEKNDQTMIDGLTGLVWTKDGNVPGPSVCAVGTRKTWQGALDYVNCLNQNNYLGYKDWILPNINELSSLFNLQQADLATWLNSEGFIGVQSNYYWSSSTSSNNGGQSAWFVLMNYGTVDDNHKSYSFFAWPVRSGQHWFVDSLGVYAVSRFGTVPTNTTHQIEVSNHSNFSQSIAALSISGLNNTEFSVTTGGANPCVTVTPTLATNASCTLMLNFNPTSIGVKIASLDITSNGVITGIPLTGTFISTVYGTVTDQSNGLPVPGAIITLNTDSVTTNSKGYYTFGNLPATSYSISAAKSGYQTTSKSDLSVTASTSANGDIVLPTIGSLNITTASLPWASANVPYNSRVMVAGGTAPYTFSRPYGTLPTGLTLDTATGTISGTPTGTGSYLFAIGVTDNVAGYSEKEFTIELLQPLQITTASLPSGQQGVAYSGSISATGGKPAYSFTLMGGTLPNGLTLDSNGSLTGTPRESDTFNISVRLTDSTGATADKSYALTLTAVAALTLNTATLPQGYIGTYYSAPLSASGGVLPWNFSVAGALPAGLSLNSATGVISGIPSAAGLTNLIFTVTDYSYPTGQTASVTLPFRIWNALSISTTSIPAGTQKTAYSTTLSGIGGVTPHSWSLASGALPQGITLDGTTGAIAGTPASCGAFPITARLTDSAAVPNSVDKSLALDIACSNDYVISGNAGVAGATVAYSGTASGTVTADGSGNFSIGPLLNGTYVVTPSNLLYVFAPASRTITVNNLDISLATFTAELDNAAPTVTGFTIPATGTTQVVAISTLTATDNAAVTGYMMTENSAAPTATEASWSDTKQTSYTFTGIPDGIATAKTLYAWAKDAAGNISNYAAATTTITLPDVTTPDVTAFTISATGANTSVPVTILTATDNVAVTGYLLTETATTPTASVIGWSVTKPSSYTFAGIPDGMATAKTLYAWAKDAAGNVSNSATATTTITLPDVTKPVVTAFTLPASSISMSVAVSSLTATDNVAVTDYLLTESSTVPLAASTDWNATKPTSYIFAEIPDGIATAKTLYAWAKDAVGNISNSSTATTTITLPDVTAPVVTAFIIPVTGTNTSVPVTTLTTTDNVTVTGYLLTETANQPQADNPAWTIDIPLSYTFATEGFKSLYVFAKDAAGNISAPLSASATITLPDIVAPTVNAFNIPPTSNSLAVPISTLTATDDVAVTGYMLTETASQPQADNPSWTVAAPNTYTFASQGVKTLYVFVKDTAGNISVPLSASVTITLPDTTAPTVTAFTMPTISDSLTVSITTLTATDDVAAIGYLLTETSSPPQADNPAWSESVLASHTFASQGVKTLYVFAKDAAGNISVPLSASVTITLPDTIAPTIDAFTLPATVADLVVPVSELTATDDVDVTSYLLTKTASQPLANDPAWSATEPMSYPFATQGAKTLYAFAKDAAGNISVPASATVTITLPDVAAPTVTAFTLPAAATSLTVPVTALTAADEIGVTGYLLTETSDVPSVTDLYWTTTPTSSYTFANAGAKTLYAWAKDAAGNISAALPAAVTITLPDTTAPTVNLLTIPPTATSLTIAVTALAATDDVAVTGYVLSESVTPPQLDNATWTSTPPTSYTLAAQGDRTIYAFAKDAAGNVSAPLSANVTISLPDTAAPTVTAFALSSTSTSLTVPVLVFTASDNVAVTGYVLSESALTPLAADPDWRSTPPGSYTFTTAGSKTLYAFAKDAAGNVSSSAIAGTTITLPVLTDTTAPTVTTFTLPATSTSLSVAISSFTASDIVGVTGYCLAATNSSSACSWSATAPSSYTFTTAGSKTLFAFAKDAAGNVSNSASASTMITLPTVVVHGDLDNDGVTTSADALLALQMAIGKKTLDMKADLAPLINGIPAPDGKVTAADALVILRKAVGLW